MGLFSFSKRAPATTSSGGDSAQVVETARKRARRRLIGAVLLLGIGVIAFPLLFETQPRPIPVDIPIEIPKKEGAAPLAMPAPRSATPAAPPVAASVPAAAAKPVITESKAETGKEVPAPAEAARPVAKAEPAPRPAAAQPPPAPAAAAPADPRPAAEAAGRFVVQVGAFADNNVAREARGKVEKLGLKTYTQAVDTDNGKRIRVRLGPFSSREDAEKVAAKVKAGGLPAAVLAL